jgi:transketolase
MTGPSLEIRRRILRASHASGHGHIPTSFSVVELLLAAYETMRHDPARPDWEERDILVLSKGHAALGYYGVLSHLGYLPEAELATLGRSGSRLGCHPDRRVPGVEVSTGSLGHGLAVAAGIALALRLKGSPRRVLAVVGDGEVDVPDDAPLVEEELGIESTEPDPVREREILVGRHEPVLVAVALSPGGERGARLVGIDEDD